MKHRIWLFLIFFIPIILSPNPFLSSVRTEDCFVQIIAVNIDQPSYGIGETVYVNLVYDLYYDLFDPLGAGALSVNLVLQGESLPLMTHQFIETGFGINTSVTFVISATDWEPDATGQIGLIQVNGWAQDSVGSMTDTAELQFSVLRSDITIHTLPLPTKITYHDQFQLIGSLENTQNASAIIPLHPLKISITQDAVIVQEWEINTTQTSTFEQEIDTFQLGAGDFSCNITTLPTGDYNCATALFSFSVLNSSVSLTPILNTTVVQAYYPRTGDSSILVSTLLTCQSTNHSMSEASLTCYLGNSTTTMINSGFNQFVAEITAPSTPGNYTILITAIVPHHNTTSVSIPIEVLPRHAVLYFSANCTEAALGDILEFSVSASDEGSLSAIFSKICSIYLYNQSCWNLLSQIILDLNGTAQFLWQTQNVGNQDFRFKLVFQGGPEFQDRETELIVTNTHEIRFVLNTTIQVIRQTNTKYLVQLTTLDYQPLVNVDLLFLEVHTNATWCTTITNSSGCAEFSWFIEEWYELGVHEFLLIAQAETVILGTIPVTIIVFEQTILELT